MSMLPTDDRRTLSRIRAFFLTAAAAAGGMFCFKLYSFLSTNRNGDMAGFAFDPIVIYGFVAAGFLCLLFWAFLSGHFRDLERPKYELFERYAEQVRAEAANQHDS